VLDCSGERHDERACERQLEAVSAACPRLPETRSVGDTPTPTNVLSPRRPSLYSISSGPPPASELNVAGDNGNFTANQRLQGLHSPTCRVCCPAERRRGRRPSLRSADRPSAEKTAIKVEGQPPAHDLQFPRIQPVSRPARGNTFCPIRNRISSSKDRGHHSFPIMDHPVPVPTAASLLSTPIHNPRVPPSDGFPNRVIRVLRERARGSPLVFGSLPSTSLPQTEPRAQHLVTAKVLEVLGLSRTAACGVRSGAGMRSRTRRPRSPAGPYRSRATRTTTPGGRHGESAAPQVHAPRAPGCPPGRARALFAALPW
jgi:hypothetical protein